MRAMVLKECNTPLELMEVKTPEPGPNEVRIKVHTCGVCRTDLHIVDGELTPPYLPLILGHQVVGTIDKLGPNVKGHTIGMRVGIPWLCTTCQMCEFCKTDRENLCDDAHFTGFNRNGGYAEYTIANAEYLVDIPDSYDDLHAAPLLCAGLIGYRAFKLAGKAKTIGFYGFGSSAHILIQIATKLGSSVYVFTRPGDEKGQEFAYSLGATWAGGSDTLPPIPLDAAIIFAPVGALYIEALKALKKGGKAISAGIHMSDIPTFNYKLLWQERSMSSVANLTRKDGHEFMEIAGKIPIQVGVTSYPLEEANAALDAIRDGSLEASAVLKIS